MNDRTQYVSNPFSTRFVRPGAIEYLFRDNWSADQLIEMLATNRWRGAIVGPHGSGKSTLLATLIVRLQERGVRPHLIVLHDGQRWLNRGWDLELNRTTASEGLTAHDRTLLVLDGYEQLNRFSRWMVINRCRRHGWGLLVTAHQEVSLPTIFRTAPSFADFQTILARLLGRHVAILTPTDQADAYARAGGNLREALFDLYDRFEERRADSNRRLVSSVEPA